MTDIVPNQRVPGGVMKQLGDAAGGVTYNQYAPGGPIGQLYTVAGMETPLDQYAPGGPLKQIETAIEALPAVSLDFVNEVYSHTLTDILESEVSNAGVVFDATKIVNGVGYRQTSGLNYGGRFKGAAGTLLYSGASIVMEFEIIDDALPTTVSWEWFDEPDYNTDLLTNTGTAQRRIRDFGSGGVSVTGAGLAVGVHTVGMVRTAGVFSLTVDDVLVGTGTPVIPVPIDEVYFSMSGPTASIAVRKIEIFAP